MISKYHPEKNDGSYMDVYWKYKQQNINWIHYLQPNFY